jgi:hypothetical protein
MSVRLTDQEIAALLEEKKTLPPNYRDLVQTRPKRGHKERELDIKGSGQSEFRLILRQSDFNSLDFSVILGYRFPQSNLVFRLRRYNGKSHEHTNTLEQLRFYDFHIHMATERYQDAGLREDWYAEPTDRYNDFHGALRLMLSECGFDLPYNPQATLFGEEAI